jgi:hypothetical protein
MIWAILLCLSAAAFLWLAKASKTPTALAPSPAAAPPAPSPTQPAAQQHPPSFPSLSALHGQTPQVTFDAADWFRRAYYSPLTAEIENNIKVVAHTNQPNDHEAFYSRFIGAGLVACLHDMTWAYIFKSQLLMLAEMNKKGGWLSLPKAKVFYDQAVPVCPKVYSTYSFESWLAYLQGETLLIRHPTDASHPVEMLEITHKGKDFLRYLAHWGRDINVRAC